MVPTFYSTSASKSTTASMPVTIMLEAVPGSIDGIGKKPIAQGVLQLSWIGKVGVTLPMRSEQWSLVAMV